MEDYKFTQKAPKIQEIFDRTLAGNKEYMPRDYSGMGRIYLDRNVEIVDNMRRCWLEQSMMTQPNTIYIIQDDFTISQDNDNTINVPNNSVLLFEGGSIKDGTLNSDNNFEVISNGKCFENIHFSGTYKRNLIADLRWFIGAYPVNTSDTSIDNTQEVIQCMTCGTRSVLFPTDKFIRLTETIVVNDSINILTDGKSKPLFAGFTDDSLRNLECPCVFSDVVVTLFEFHLGAYEGYDSLYKQPFVIGDINLVTTKRYDTISLDPTSPNYRGTPILYLDNKFARGNVWGVKLNCSIASRNYAIPIDLESSGTKKTGYNWTGIELRTVENPYTQSYHSIAFLEINGDIFNLGVGFATYKGDGGAYGWFNDVIVRGHIECSLGCTSECGGPVVIYGNHQTRRMNESLRTQMGYFKSKNIYLYGYVWDTDNAVDDAGWVSALTMIETTDTFQFNSICPSRYVVPLRDYRNPNPSLVGRNLMDMQDIRKFQNILYYGLNSDATQYDIVKDLSYDIQFVTGESGGEVTHEEEYIPSLHTGRIINEHCLFNDQIGLPYTQKGAYPALENTNLDVAYTPSKIYKLRISFELRNWYVSVTPIFLLIGNWSYGNTGLNLPIKISLKTKNSLNAAWETLYSEENPLVLNSYSYRYIDNCWRVDLNKLGIQNYVSFSITFDYYQMPNQPNHNILPMISIPWYYGEVAKLRYCSTDKLPYLNKFNKGWNTFNATIKKPVWWNGSEWVSAQGYSIAAKTHGTTSERPTAGNLKASDIGFEYYDTDLGIPVYVESIDEATGDVVWVDSNGNLADYEGKTDVRLREGYTLTDELRVPEGTTDEEFKENTVITDINSCIADYGVYSEFLSAVIFDASAGDTVSVTGVAAWRKRLWYVIDKATGKVTNLSPARDEDPADAYKDVIRIETDSWVVVNAYNEHYTREVGGMEVPYPYRNAAGTPYKVILYANTPVAEIPAYGDFADRPSDLLDETKIGFHYFATDLGDNGKPIYWNGTIWVDAAGAIIEQEPEPTPEPSQEEPENQ